MTSNTQDIIYRLLNGELSEKEMSNLRQDPEMADVLRIVTEMDTWRLPESHAKEQAWESLSARLQPVARVRRMTPLIWLTAAAAATVALIALVIIPSSGTNANNWQTASAETQSISLPDGSEVVLNAGSQLAMTGSWDNERRVDLSGSALFSVEKGNPFIVETSQGEVQVLGTSFEVVADEESYVVKCFEGTVAVRSVGLETDTLTAGEGVRLVNGAWVTLPTKGNVPQWLRGITEFDSAPIREVLNAYERQFGLTVEYSGDDRKYTGAFPHSDPNEALEMILQPMHLEIEAKEGEMIRLRKLID